MWKSHCDKVLSSFCVDADRAHKRASEERRKELFGNNIPIEIVVMRSGKIKVEIRKENAGHKEPHLHIKHSDQFDASISLNDFRVLAGKLDTKTMKYLMPELKRKQKKYRAIWRSLNEEEDSVGVERLVGELVD
jgi:hypothetical protein